MRILGSDPLIFPKSVDKSSNVINFATLSVSYSFECFLREMKSCKEEDCQRTLV